MSLTHTTAIKRTHGTAFGSSPQIYGIGLGGADVTAPVHTQAAVVGDFVPDQGQHSEFQSTNSMKNNAMVIPSGNDTGMWNISVGELLWCDAAKLKVRGANGKFIGMSAFNGKNLAPYQTSDDLMDELVFGGVAMKSYAFNNALENKKMMISAQYGGASTIVNTGDVPIVPGQRVQIYLPEWDQLKSPIITDTWVQANQNPKSSIPGRITLRVRPFDPSNAEHLLRSAYYRSMGKLDRLLPLSLNFSDNTKSKLGTREKTDASMVLMLENSFMAMLRAAVLRKKVMIMTGAKQRRMLLQEQMVKDLQSGRLTEEKQEAYKKAFAELDKQKILDLSTHENYRHDTYSEFIKIQQQSLDEVARKEKTHAVLSENASCTEILENMSVEEKRALQNEVLWMAATIGLIEPENINPKFKSNGPTPIVNKRLVEDALNNYHIKFIPCGQNKEMQRMAQAFTPLLVESNNQKRTTSLESQFERITYKGPSIAQGTLNANVDKNLRTVIGTALTGAHPGEEFDINQSAK